jgi:hypothetical protein
MTSSTSCRGIRATVSSSVSAAFIAGMTTMTLPWYAGMGAAA